MAQNPLKHDDNNTIIKKITQTSIQHEKNGINPPHYDEKTTKHDHM